MPGAEVPGETLQCSPESWPWKGRGSSLNPQDPPPHTTQEGAHCLTCTWPDPSPELKGPSLFWHDDFRGRALFCDAVTWWETLAGQGFSCLKGPKAQAYLLYNCHLLSTDRLTTETRCDLSSRETPTDVPSDHRTTVLKGLP